MARFQQAISASGLSVSPAYDAATRSLVFQVRLALPQSTEAIAISLGEQVGGRVSAEQLSGALSARAGQPDEVGDAVDQHGGLAAAGTGKDEQWAVCGKHGLPLHIVQAAELLFNVSITQGAEFLPERCCHGFTCFLRCYSYRIV